MPRSLVAVLRVVGASGLTLDSFEFVEFFEICVKLVWIDNIHDSTWVCFRQYRRFGNCMNLKMFFDCINVFLIYDFILKFFSIQFIRFSFSFLFIFLRAEFPLDFCQWSTHLDFWGFLLFFYLRRTFSALSFFFFVFWFCCFILTSRSIELFEWDLQFISLFWIFLAFLSLKSKSPKDKQCVWQWPTIPVVR